MAGKAQKLQESPKWYANQNLQRVGALALAALLIFGIVSFINRPKTRGGEIGPLSSSCRKVPQFAKDSGISNAAFDTSRRGIQGLVLYDVNTPDKIMQAPSWTDAGNLGPLAFDSNGTIYVAPVPNINTLTNPPAKQNTIYQVDPQSGVLSEFYALQNVPLPNQTNPYGIISLAFDCETGVLYASTVSGSTADKTNGSIVAIDVTSKQEIGRLHGIDALSVGLFTDHRGAHLYYGLANRSEVWRVGLTKTGSFAGKPQKVLSYDQFNELKPRKLVFLDNKTMQLHTTEFRYNLVASTEYRQENINFTYSEAKDTWSRQR